MTEMDLNRFRGLAEAWGGDIDRWPAEHRAAARALASKSADAKACLAEEGHLDDLILSASSERAPASLRVSVAKIPDASPKIGRLLADLWPFGSIWRPLAGLAAAASIGLAVGLSVPPSSSNTVTADTTLLALSGDLYTTTAFEAFGLTDSTFGSLD